MCGVRICFVLRAVLDEWSAVDTEIGCVRSKKGCDDRDRVSRSRRVIMIEIRQFKNYDDRERLSAYSLIHITAVSITPNE